MRDSTIEKVIIGTLFLIVAASMAERGASGAIAPFIGFLLVPYGFGRVLYSERPFSEWSGWLSMATGVAIIWYLQSTTAAMYAGLAVLAQIVARLLGSFFYPKSGD